MKGRGLPPPRTPADGCCALLLREASEVYDECGMVQASAKKKGPEAGGRRAAVDVGCGTGVLAGTLALHFARVTGIDADAANARLAQDPRVTIRRCGLEQFAAAAGEGGVDLITMVAVLHHLCLEDTLARIPGLPPTCSSPSPDRPPPAGRAPARRSGSARSPSPRWGGCRAGLAPAPRFAAGQDTRGDTAGLGGRLRRAGGARRSL